MAPISLTVSLPVGLIAIGIAGVHYGWMEQGLAQWLFFIGCIIIFLELYYLFGAHPIIAAVISLSIFIVLSAYVTPDPIGNWWHDFTESISNGFNSLIDHVFTWLKRWWWAIVAMPFIIYGLIWLFAWLGYQRDRWD